MYPGHILQPQTTPQTLCHQGKTTTINKFHSKTRAAASAQMRLTTRCSRGAFVTLKTRRGGRCQHLLSATDIQYYCLKMARCNKNKLTLGSLNCRCVKSRQTSGGFNCPWVLGVESFGSRPWGGCSFGALKRRRASPMAFWRCCRRLAEETSRARLRVAHHVFLYFAVACSCKAKGAGSARIRPECRIIPKRVRCLCSVLAIAAMLFVRVMLCQKSLRLTSKNTTYNPAGHRIFGLFKPFLEHTKPVGFGT